MANATLRYQQTLNISCFPSYQSPVTSHQSPVTSHQSPVTSHQSPAIIAEFSTDS
ncbi:hypothetical protein H6F47_02805 [Sphaerospermopsis sp. FACHB-1094]|uniref:hypothetical protein n=1 Tax=Sphaerospermopsis sp. FACHB-1094 TaxID=2692861 RepID=UPI00168831F1|nr:hypothetical protein [Sphaerospermopsis sp. FACHB-1094]MBD2131412.1 hypothetical protein [Sphaerospermopsis sp. FACHB-1094]